MGVGSMGLRRRVIIIWLRLCSKLAYDDCVCGCFRRRSKCNAMASAIDGYRQGCLCLPNQSNSQWSIPGIPWPTGLHIQWLGSILTIALGRRNTAITTGARPCWCHGLRKGPSRYTLRRQRLANSTEICTIYLDLQSYEGPPVMHAQTARAVYVSNRSCFTCPMGAPQAWCEGGGSKAFQWHAPKRLQARGRTPGTASFSPTRSKQCCWYSHKQPWLYPLFLRWHLQLKTQLWPQKASQPIVIRPDPRTGHSTSNTISTTQSRYGIHKTGDHSAAGCAVGSWNYRCALCTWRVKKTQWPHSSARSHPFSRMMIENWCPRGQKHPSHANFAWPCLWCICQLCWCWICHPAANAVLLLSCEKINRASSGKLSATCFRSRSSGGILDDEGIKYTWDGGGSINLSGCTWKSCMWHNSMWASCARKLCVTTRDQSCLWKSSACETLWKTELCTRK